MRSFINRTLLVILIVIAGAVAWACLTHRVSYVVTDGVSMRPLYRAGDLIVVARADNYRIGDIIAYRVGRVTVLHRVIGGDAGGFITKGDNNQSVDPARPTSTQALGRAVLHIPSGGVWLRRANSPPVIAALVFFIVIGAGGATHRRRRRGTRKRQTRQRARRGHTAMGATVASTPDGLLRAGMSAVLSSPRLRAAAGVIAAVAVAGAILALPAWTRPAVRYATVEQPAAHSMTFSYAATVPLTPAYDTTIVRSPEPVFRKVAKDVAVTFGYTGPPGRTAVKVTLSTASGWHSTFPITAEETRVGAAYRGVVRLDVAALQARADAGAEATGTRATEVGVTVLPRITEASGTFEPAFKLKLTPLALTADGPFVAQDAGAPKKVARSQSLRLGGRAVASVSTARIVSTALIFGAIVAAAACLASVRRRPSIAESIFLHHRRSLVEVRPMAPPPDRPVVHLTEFTTMARLAKRYGLPITYWSAPESTTFAVHDDAVTYWYCVETQEPADDPLTHLAGGSLFEAAVRSALEASHGAGMCLMLIDVDGFTAVNATYGRHVGDAVLVAIAERLRRTVRPRDLVARLGSDDFAVLFEDVGRAQAHDIADRLERNVNEPLSVLGHQVQVRASLGIVEADGVTDAGALMERAGAALARAKTTRT